MDDQANQAQDRSTAANAYSNNPDESTAANAYSNNPDGSDTVNIHQSKNEIALPLVALGLDFLPFLLGFLNSRQIMIPMFSLLTILAPIAGIITGVAALSRGKVRIGAVGKTIAIISIALPLALVALIIIFFIGAATGLISLM